MNGNNEEQVDIEAESKDEKKLSKGQLKKLKEKAKKDAETKAEAPAAEASQAGETADKEENADVDEDAGAQGEGEGTKGLSKGQLKKLKEKAKKEAKGPEEKKEEEADTKDKKKGGKKPTAVAELARKRLEEQKKLDEEIKRLEAEAKAKEDEERRKQEEEDRIQREIEEEKKRKKQEKKDQLKKEGKYMTKSQKEAARALEERRKELIAQGIIQDTPEEEGGENAGKPKSIAVRTRKPKGKKETGAQQEEAKETEGKDENKDAQEKKVEDFANWEEEYADTTVVRPKAETDKPDEESWETFDANATNKTEETAKPKDKAPKEKVEKTKVESKPQKTEEKPNAEAQPEKKETAAPVEVEKKKDTKKEESKTGGPNEKIRSPIICILGHVDTGKTKLLDNMRSTNVQEGEAGGITQQIGATFFPYEKLSKEITKTQGHYPVDIQIPGLLIIDTPGHESFSNLRSRGSGLCDIAILVVDIMHGLEKQTLESIELLRFRKTPFVIALNKVDRIYGWKPKNDTSSYVSLKKQEKHCQLEFRDRSKGIMTELTEKGFNVALYYDNPDPNNYVSIIPTSAMTGEGISDLLSVAVNLTQKWLNKKITKKDDFKCTVLEVKVIEGLGASIDIMLVDGTIREGDKIVLAGYDGPIVTTVRALLTPHPMREMRVKNEYIHHKQISGAMGIKVSANDLEKALAGSELYIAKNEEEEVIYKKLLEEEIAKVKKSIKLVEEGVLVAASTLGSLEALLQFLKTSNIPVSTISIGPVSKAEVIKAMKPLQITEGEIKKEYATILAFDVKVLPDAKELAEQEGVKIFTANIIYHLFDHFTAYLQELREERKRNEGKLAVFPVVIRPVAFFNMKDPIVMGIDVLEGQLRLNTPLCVVEKGKLRIGTVESMEKEHKPIQVVRPSDGSVAIKLRGDSTILAGRHFELKDKLVSIVSRESIDALKKYFRDEMSKGDWELVKKLKSAFGVI